MRDAVPVRPVHQAALQLHAGGGDVSRGEGLRHAMRSRKPGKCAVRDFHTSECCVARRPNIQQPECPSPVVIRATWSAVKEPHSLLDCCLPSVCQSAAC